MFWLSIFDNEVLHLVAETSIIVTGSILMGILLAYLYWGGYKKRVVQLTNKLDLERDLVLDLKNQLNEISLIRDHLASELSQERIKYSIQSKSLYDQGQKLYQSESQIRENKSTIEQLNSAIKSYEDRLKVIEAELLQSKGTPAIPKKSNSAHAARANYDHVSQLLGRQVTENDLTLIAGIGLRTASLLQKSGIETWKALAERSPEELRQILAEAGGIYKSQDPTHWPKQASMAAQSEWRKLRVFQETLKKIIE